MSEDQKIAACVLYLFSVLAYHSRENDHDYGWYGWCVDQFAKYQTTDNFTAMVFWSMRAEDEDPDEDWLGYLEYKLT